MVITDSKHIQQHEIDSLARCLLPEIQKFFDSPEGKQEFEEWQKNRNVTNKSTGKK